MINLQEFVTEALVQISEGTRQVAEFSDDGALQFNQPDDHSQNQNRADQHKFCGQNHTSFIIPESLHHVFDLSCTSEES